ncbi:chromatin organization modifier domain-containing protein [Gigaspora margarita]|uniref:Chromatin organization modifier domain-containing protein n=1 Tax=Gigaspora margarita TaxID=4874 RepID=A0A8H3X7Z2_GIGMA|nr:chromatin organization modifier domain-containing protein [Gigaspora margarita]
MTRNKSEEEMVDELGNQFLNYDEEESGATGVESSTTNNVDKDTSLATADKADQKVGVEKDQTQEQPEEPSGQEPANGDSKKEGDKDEDEDKEEEEIYEVEQVLQHKEKRGVKYYLIKWKGFGEDECTWEAETNVYADDLVEEYWTKKKEEEEETASTSKSKGRKRAAQSTALITKQDAKRQRSSKKTKSPRTKMEEDEFDEDWENQVVAVETVTRDDKTGELLVYLKWKNGETSRHPAKDANARCPQKMIKFYEQRLTFAPPANHNKT